MTVVTLVPSDNPYLSDRLFVGREEELTEVRYYLAHGESAILVGGRRVGKTSLAARIGDIGRPVFHLDADAWDLSAERNVLGEIGAAIGGACSTRAELTALLKARCPLALVVDEADRILAETWAGSFLSYLRFLVDKEFRTQLAILLIGGPVLNRYRNPDDKGSPPLNTARRVYLQPLSRKARQELAAPLPVTPDFNWLDLQAGGHPWLLKRLLEELWRGRAPEAALEKVFEESLPNFEIWKRQLGNDGERFLRALPGEGIARSSLRKDPSWRQYHAASVLTRSLCLVDLDDNGHILPGPALFADWLGDTASAEQWDIAISYASEDAAFARAIAQELRNDYRVFFAPDQQAYLWGSDLYRALPHVYGVNAKLVLVLSSPAYVKKHWTQVEWKVARANRAGRLLLLEMGALPSRIPKGLAYRSATPELLISLIGDLKRRLDSMMNSN